AAQAFVDDDDSSRERGERQYPAQRGPNVCVHHRLRAERVDCETHRDHRDPVAVSLQSQHLDYRATGRDHHEPTDDQRADDPPGGDRDDEHRECRPYEQRESRANHGDSAPFGRARVNTLALRSWKSTWNFGDANNARSILASPPLGIEPNASVSAFCDAVMITNACG